MLDLPAARIPGFAHQIEVDKSLVRLLSEHTYTSFTNCIRELVVNAYDADATKVSIDIDIASHTQNEYAGTLSIADNGHGMVIEEFIRYARIAPGGLPRDRSRTFGRLRVGKFGIGYLAAFPFCETLELRTSTGSGEEIIATFKCADYFKNIGNFQSIGDIPVEARLEQRRSPDLQYKTGTRLELRGLSREARSYLGPTRTERKSRVDSIWDWSGLKRLEWELGQVLPILWQPQYREWQKNLGIIQIGSRDPGLEVLLNKRRVEKPWPSTREGDFGLTKHFPRDVDIDLDHPQHTFSVSQSKNTEQDPSRALYRYLVVTPHGPIEPLEFRGVQLRLRGVGLGLPISYRDLGLTKENELIRWLIEIHLTTEVFDQQITLDRTQLKKSPLAAALRRSLEGHVLAQCRQFGNTESKLQRALKNIQRASSGESIEPFKKTVATIEETAKKLGYEIRHEPIKPEEASIDTKNCEVVLPSQPPKPTIRISKDHLLNVVEGSPNDPDLKREWVRINPKFTQVEVSPELRETIKGPFRYRQVLETLTRIDWRRLDYSTGKPAQVQQAIASFARQIKNDLVALERR